MTNVFQLTTWSRAYRAHGQTQMVINIQITCIAITAMILEKMLPNANTYH